MAFISILFAVVNMGLYFTNKEQRTIKIVNLFCSVVFFSAAMIQLID